MTDEPIQVCPECAGRVRRVFHPVGIIFKGSGFYVTDNRRISGGSGRKGKSSTGGSSNGRGEEAAAASKSESEKARSKS